MILTFHKNCALYLWLCALISNIPLAKDMVLFPNKDQAFNMARGARSIATFSS
jgi:hypothetical protein